MTGIFLFANNSRLDLEPTQPTIQRVSGAHSSGIMRPGCEAYHTPLYSVEVKNACSFIYTPQYLFTARWLFKQWIRPHGV